jgi:hypothetical protein
VGLLWAYCGLILGLFWAYSGLIRFAGVSYSGLILGLFVKTKFHGPPEINARTNLHRGDPCFLEQVFFFNYTVLYKVLGTTYHCILNECSKHNLQNVKYSGCNCGEIVVLALVRVFGRYHIGVVVARAGALVWQVSHGHSSCAGARVRQVPHGCTTYYASIFIPHVVHGKPLR